MSLIVHELILIARRTRFGKRVNQWSLRVFGKEIAKFAGRDLTLEAEKIAARALQRDLVESTKLIEAFVIMEAGGIFDSLARSYPALFRYLDRGSLAEMVRNVIKRGDKSFESLRGVLVEALARKIPSVDALHSALDTIRRSANKAFKEKWGPVRLVSGVRDGSGKELGDLMMICEDDKGRVWVMAIIESKSFSNVSELAVQENKKVGQHLWDWTRAKTRGISIEGKHYPANKVEIHPVPAAAWGGRAYVPEKTAAQRVKEMTGHYTEFIGFAPQEMSTDKLGMLAVNGVQLEYWPWPFSVSDFNAFQKDLIKAVDKVLR